jgi:hypothetical protein
MKDMTFGRKKKKKESRDENICLYCCCVSLEFAKKEDGDGSPMKDVLWHALAPQSPLDALEYVVLHSRRYGLLLLAPSSLFHFRLVLAAIDTVVALRVPEDACSD